MFAGCVYNVDYLLVRSHCGSNRFPRFTDSVSVFQRWKSGNYMKEAGAIVWT